VLQIKIKYHTVGIVPISNKNNSRNRDKIGIPTTHIKAFKLSNILRVVEFFVLVTRPPSSSFLITRLPFPNVLENDQHIYISKTTVSLLFLALLMGNVIYFVIVM
jgi:hypothetical protein